MSALFILFHLDLRSDDVNRRRFRALRDRRRKGMAEYVYMVQRGIGSAKKF